MKYLLSRLLIYSFFICCFPVSGFSQTLFTYGDQPVSKEDFLKAYRKNNTTGKPTSKSYREYLELYIRYKLKVKAAYDLRLDTLPNQVVELQNFRNQIVDQYMNDQTSLNKLVNEAFLRSQKDIHLAYIFVSVPKNGNPADSVNAYQKIMEAYAELKLGKNFGTIAAEYSEDPFAKNTQGDIGYITVFTLPYELETLAYNTPSGKFSKPFHGKGGYFIFKNLGERKALGKIKVSQILMIFPHNATDAIKADVKKRADSIYHALLNGSDFAELAKKFSGDNLSYQNGGILGEFGIGKFEPAFENAAFALSKDGEISQPVLTSFGYHIIKRIYRKPIPVTRDKKTMDAVKQQVMSDSRIESSRQEMLQHILKVIQFKAAPIDLNHLFVYTDSSLLNKHLPVFSDVDNKTVLFSFAKKNILVKDWVDYRKGMRNFSQAVNAKSNSELLDLYKQTVSFDYYRNHLEDYNKDFAYQLNEFRDGNLLFEIMQRKVWDKASTDSVGLKNYYESHKNNYWWQPSANAIIFTCSDEHTAHLISSQLPANPLRWRRLVDSTNGLAQADSGRFEFSQLPPPESNHWQEGQFTSLAKNQADNAVTTAYIIHVFNDKMPRGFTEARGLVINDYQTYIEDEWISELKKKYPVKVNEAVFKTLPLK